MRKTGKWLRYGPCLALFLVLGARLAYVAGRADTGWETLGTTWRDTALGPFGLRPTTLTASEPIAQAEFWLGETERILREHPRDAELCLGAAWVLDSPVRGFYRDHVRLEEFYGSRRATMPDEEAVRRMEDQFEARCARRVLELAATATRLEPARADFWRQRAMLLFRAFHNDEPRDPNYLKILDQCAEHDPDAGLYDDLAARQLWEESVRFDWTGRHSRLIVDNRERFAEAAQRLERGLQAQRFGAPQGPSRAVVRFLTYARLPRIEAGKVAASRSDWLRKQTLATRMLQLRHRLAEEISRTGDAAAALALHRQAEQFFDQVLAGDEASELAGWLHLLRGSNLSATRYLGRATPGLLSAVELRTRENQEREERLHVAILQRAIDNVRTRGPQSGRIGDAIPTAVMVYTQTLASALLLFGLAGSCLARVLGRRLPETDRLHPLHHLTAWLTGVTLIFVVTGLFPAEVISRSA
jgi:hypothetical protein